MDAYCGLYCGACLCNIVREEGNIEEVAAKTGRTIEQLTCSDCKTAQMKEDCSFVACCLAKDYRNCSECPDMPCEDLARFASDGLYHHILTIPNLLRIRAIGVDAWLSEQKQKYTCQECGARLSWSNMSCDHSG